MISNADVVFCMTASHVAAAQALVGEGSPHAAKIVLLDPDGDMEDPIGMGQSAYDSLSERLMQLIPQRLTEMLSNEDRPRIRSSR
jgi:hypothetical protein